MPYDPDKRYRRSIRLPKYDYTSAGAYFVTIVTHGRECTFGEIVDGVMHTNAAGQMVQRRWLDLANRFPGLALDIFVVMPNHFHGILFVPDVGAALVVAQDRAGTSPAPTKTGRRWTLGEIVGAFKSITTHAYIQGVEQVGWVPFPGRLWQRNYYEHIIRDEESLNRIRQYILNNPARWAFDRENPAATTLEPENAWLG